MLGSPLGPCAWQGHIKLLLGKALPDGLPSQGLLLRGQQACQVLSCLVSQASCRWPLLGGKVPHPPKYLGQLSLLTEVPDLHITQLLKVLSAGNLLPGLVSKTIQMPLHPATSR